jgi:Rha family phage regulatory protein
MSDLVVLSSNPQGLTHISSLQVAEIFGREHKSILRTINSLIDEGILLSALSALSEYKDSTGRSLPMFLLTEAGFATLSMAMNFSSDEDKALRREVMKQFYEKNSALILQNIKLKQRNEALEANEAKLLEATSSGYKRRKTPIYGNIVNYETYEDGNEYPVAIRVLREDHTEEDLIDGEICKNRSIIFGLELKNEKLFKRKAELNRL